MTGAEGVPPDTEPAGRVEAQPPAVLGELRVGARRTVAGGLPAVASTARRMLAATGLRRGVHALAHLNQTDGYDCPSCAWPDPSAGDRSFVEFCENGAKAAADAASDARCDPEFFSRWSLPALSRQTDRWLGEQGRLTHPMIRRPGSDHYEPVAWDEAFRTVGEHLRALDSPDRAVFYTSGRTSNEAAFLYQLFVRAYGTNNLPDCSNMCHESSGAALTETIGIGKGTVLLEDFDHAELIVVIGQNPGTNHPRMLSALQRAKERGAVMVGVNPLPEAGLVGFRNPQDLAHLDRLRRAADPRPTKLSDLFVPVKVGGDLALLTGVQKAMVERHRDRGGVIDEEFVRDRTSGFDELVAHLDRVSWDDVVSGSGVDRSKIEAFAELLATHRRIISCWAMGLTQHEHAVGTIQQLVNIHLMRGAIGTSGAGLCPVRGHSNVQGDRTVGIWERPPASFLDALEARFGFAAPREHGLDTVGAIRAMAAGDVDVFVGMGGNFLSATPDTEATAAGLARCALTVQISTTLNRGHLVTGRTGLILPCLSRLEEDVQETGRQFVTVENSMGIVHPSTGRAKPASAHLRSEPAIVAGLARGALGDASPLDFDQLVADYDRIRDAIEEVVDGFGDYNRRVREPGGFELPNGPRHGEFPTVDARARFTTYELPTAVLPPDALMLMTLRSHDQFNTRIYGDDDRYRGVFGGRRVVFCHEDDLGERGLVGGDVVDLVSDVGGARRVAERFVVVPYAIPRGCVGAYFPEANAVVPLDHTARGSNTPASKSVPVMLRPTGERLASHGR